MGKINVAVVMGGFSSEKEISIKSGNVVANVLDKEKYNVFNVHILSRKWFVLLDDTEFEIDKNDFSATINNKKITFEVVFNAIHGNPVENGKLIAYFELINQKHTSAPFYQMALTFNKRDCLSVLYKYKVPMAKSIYLNQGDEINEDAIVNKIGLPCFVKPNSAGSSYGISKVYKKEKLQDALDFAFAEDSEVLIESFLDGTEVSVGVVKLAEGVKVIGITEIVTDNDFFDYEAKYLGKSEEITPARISAKEQKAVEKLAKNIYTVLNMQGITRSEFILVNGVPHFIEMNTVPGLSEASIFPKQIIASGDTLTNFFTKTIQAAL